MESHVPVFHACVGIRAQSKPAWDHPGSLSPREGRGWCAILMDSSLETVSRMNPSQWFRLSGAFGPGSLKFRSPVHVGRRTGEMAGSQFRAATSSELEVEFQPTWSHFRGYRRDCR